ncbi:MAG: hypothetical protein ACQEQ4_05270 [Fibrobacterota bacterium]
MILKKYFSLPKTPASIKLGLYLCVVCSHSTALHISRLPIIRIQSNFVGNIISRIESCEEGVISEDSILNSLRTLRKSVRSRPVADDYYSLLFIEAYLETLLYRETGTDIYFRGADSLCRRIEELFPHTSEIPWLRAHLLMYGGFSFQGTAIFDSLHRHRTFTDTEFIRSYLRMIEARYLPSAAQITPEEFPNTIDGIEGSHHSTALHTEEAYTTNKLNYIIEYTYFIRPEVPFTYFLQQPHLTGSHSFTADPPLIWNPKEREKVQLYIYIDRDSPNVPYVEYVTPFISNRYPYIKTLNNSHRYMDIETRAHSDYHRYFVFDYPVHSDTKKFKYYPTGERSHEMIRFTLVIQSSNRTRKAAMELFNRYRHLFFPKTNW